MTSDLAIELCRVAVMNAVLVSGPVLLCAFAISLIVGFVQALTQIQDQSLTFIPKLVVVTVAILFLLPWSLSLISGYATDVIRGIPGSI